MPIADVTIAPDLRLDRDELADFTTAWSEASGVSAEHMTVTFTQAGAQSGEPYDLAAKLHLPSLWPDDRIDALQLGLAHALAERFGIGRDRVIVMTSILPSGRVVDRGEIETW